MTMADAARTNDVTTPGPAPQHPRSCVVCRQRKVKCDRQQPCSNCTRSACVCVYPTGRGRAPKRARRVADAQLVDKLARLESIVQHLAAENGPGLVKGSSQPQSTDAPEQSRSTPEYGLTPDSSAQHETSGAATSISGRSSPVPFSIETSMSRLIIDDKKSYYVSNPLWATMAQEIEELRDFLVESEEEHEDGNVSSNTNAALFGYRAIAYSLQPYHPPLSQAVDLFAAFNENVSPLLRIFHMPTLSTIYWEAVASPISLDKDVEALIFAVYYSATVSLTPEQCSSILGLTHEAAIERYRFAVEQAIARADLLTTQSVVLLQAAVLFIGALRSHDGSRVSWSLTTLVFQLAQTMGLHRDGTVFGLKPFETEMRRRLWWQICILDSRPSDHDGFASMVYQSLSDTRLPLNINDEDLSPDMTALPPERDEATEMCFCLVRCEAMSAANKMKLLSPGLPMSSTQEGLGPSSLPLEERVKVIRELEARLHDRYIRHCHPSSPIQFMTILLSRLIVVHFWLIICYPLMGTNRPAAAAEPAQARPPPQQQATTNPSHQPPPPDGQPEAHLPGPPSSSHVPTLMTRDQLFAASVETLQLSAQITLLDAAHKWSWFTKIHAHWHIAAFVLSELCRRPPSPACERAWAAVTTMYTVWNAQSGATPGLMWKSVRRLMARTKYVREMQALRSGGRRAATAAAGPVGDGAVNRFPDPATSAAGQESLLNLASSLPATMWDSSATIGGSGAVDPSAQLDFHRGILDMADDDAFTDMMDLPIDVPMGDFFNSLDPSAAGIATDVGDGQPGMGAHDWGSW